MHTTPAAIIAISQHPTHGAWSYTTTDNDPQFGISPATNAAETELAAVLRLLHATRNQPHLTIYTPTNLPRRLHHQPTRHPQHHTYQRKLQKLTAGRTITYHTGTPTHTHLAHLSHQARKLARHAARYANSNNAHTEGPGITHPPRQHITAATDGSYLPETGVGGWAYYIDHHNWQAGGTPRGGSAHQMELAAITQLLHATNTQQPLTIVCDAKTLVQQLNQPQDGNPTLDPIRHQLTSRNITLQWVRGHNGHTGNTAADRAARGAARHQARTLTST